MMTKRIKIADTVQIRAKVIVGTVARATVPVLAKKVAINLWTPARQLLTGVFLFLVFRIWEI